MSARFDNQELLFNCSTKLSLNEKERVELYVQSQILERSEQQSVCSLQGSLTAPLGHYMVLGTTNYVAKKSEVDKTLDTSRFAFVIQVVEADSYAPEKSTSPR